MVRHSPEGCGRNGYRSGLVTIFGRPNVGKSTLLNRLVGQTVAIVTPVAQTTRRRIRAVVHGKNWQAVLIDTPGLFLDKSQKQPALKKKMIAEAQAALHEADLAVLLVEADGRGSRPQNDEEDALVMQALRQAGRPSLLVINKIDRLKEPRQAEEIGRVYRHSGLFEGVLAISALKGTGVGKLLEAIAERLPPGPPYFPPDMITDESERSIAAELIRQQLILQSEEEIPFRSAVELVSFRPAQSGRLVVIEAIIHVERESQKAIVIGKGGRRLKAIGSAARRNIQKLLGEKVYLELRVKATPGWYRTDAGLRRTGQYFP